MLEKLFSFGSLLILASASTADPPTTNSTQPIELGMSYEIRSVILQETRVLNVQLPLGYEDGTDGYPVVYLLDGAIDEDYHHVSGLLRFLETYELMPPSILVGIANSDRLRDMTFPTEIEELLERAPQAGGSTDFRRFLGEELKPYVEANFRTEGKTTLIGQSLAGLFATEVFVEEPMLFDDFIIVSASLWWDDHSLVPRIAESLQKNPQKEGTLCIVAGTEGYSIEGPAHSFAAALFAHAPEGLKWHHVPLPEESHATILHRGLYRAFELIYGETYAGL